MNWTIEHQGHYVPMQYDLRDDPWKMLIACALLRRTGGHVVKPVLDDFFERWPGPLEYMMAPMIEVIEVLKPCGLQNIKQTFTINLTVDYLKFVLEYRRQPTAQEVATWKFAGRYLCQSYMLFIDRKPLPPGEDIADHVLEGWLRSPLYDTFMAMGRLL